MKRFTKTTLAAGLLALITQSHAANTPTNNTTATPAEKAKIEAVVHDYLIKKPEVLIEAMQVLQRKQMEQTEQTVKTTQKTAGTFANALFHQANDPVRGNPNGTITVVEFFDYQCSHCVSMSPIMDAIIKANPNVRVVYKEFPIRGPISEFASRAALAANKQGKYESFSHALLASTKPLTEESILEIAKTNNLDVEQLKKDMNTPAVKTQLDNTIKLAKDLKLFGTPAIFVGKTDAKSNGNIHYIPGKADEKQLQDLIQQASK